MCTPVVSYTFYEMSIFPINNFLDIVMNNKFTVYKQRNFAARGEWENWEEKERERGEKENGKEKQVMGIEEEMGRDEKNMG